ncbi:hypothetical protein AMTRI_Chr04g248310 [Amborella trichopoda]
MVAMAARDLLGSSPVKPFWLRGFAAVSASMSKRLVPNPPDLVSWVVREGGFVHKGLRIADGEASGLCLMASSDIEAGSDLISLPKHIPLSFPSSGSGQKWDASLFRIAQKVPEELWAMRLGLKLLHERAKVGSFWWPYISNLPETFNIPIFFSGEGIKDLQYAPLIHQVNKRCRFLLDFEKQVKSILKDVGPEEHPFGGQEVNASSLGWAMSAVSSRAFRLHGEELTDGVHEDMPMLLPLIDMCNHSFHPNARIIQEKGSNEHDFLIKVVAETQMEQDAPVLLNYGCLSNDLFLLDYGFVLPKNPYDFVELKYDGGLLDAASLAAGIFSANISSPSPWQQQILTELKLEGTGADHKFWFQVRLGGPEVVDGRLLAALRVLLADNAEDVKQINQTALQSFSSDPPLGVSIEISALRTVLGLCAISLQHFPTMIAEDEKALKNGEKIFPAMESALRFRMRKKTLIIDTMRDITRRLNSLSEQKVCTLII